MRVTKIEVLQKKGKLEIVKSLIDWLSDLAVSARRPSVEQFLENADSKTENRNLRFLAKDFKFDVCRQIDYSCIDSFSPTAKPGVSNMVLTFESVDEFLSQFQIVSVPFQTVVLLV